MSKLLKFFPTGAASDVNILKSLAGPNGNTGVRFIPTGGVPSSNLATYLKLPIVAAIGGSWMVDKQLLNESKWAELTRITREAVAAAAALRQFRGPIREHESGAKH